MKYVLSVLICLGLSGAYAAENENTPDVGKRAAQKYFNKRAKKTKKNRTTASSGGGARYLALHAGAYLNDDTYKWGSDDNSGRVGQMTFGVTYRVGEWEQSMDLLFRGDFNSYSLKEGRALKMSLLGMITFPDVRSTFPLYFGGGAGLGVYLKQIEDEGDLSFDYQVVAGGRFFNVFDSIGLFFEAGLKNHINLLSDGQFNGTFLSVGTVFDF